MAIVEQERPVERTVTEANVLERAAYNFEEGIYEWCQRAYGLRGSGTHCVVGAIWAMAHEMGVSVDPEVLAVPGYDEGDISQWLDVPRSAMGWNDESGRTMKEVVTALRDAAVSLRANAR